MECDLCRHQNTTGTQLCDDCSAMIARLVAIEKRMVLDENAEPGHAGMVSLMNVASAPK